MEFRHDSWFDDDVRDCLRAANRALCFAHEDDDTDADVERRFAATADWGYLRLRGSDYSDEEMTAWGARVLEQGWVVFFKHEDEGLA